MNKQWEGYYKLLPDGSEILKVLDLKKSPKKVEVTYKVEGETYSMISTPYVYRGRMKDIKQECKKCKEIEEKYRLAVFCLKDVYDYLLFKEGSTKYNDVGKTLDALGEIKWNL